MKIEAGQVAVVTGGASGIGLALAARFARRGLRVVIADVRRDPLPAAEAAVRAAAGPGAEVLGVVTDVRDPDDVDALAAATLDRFGRVDLLCNNAGVVGPQAPVWEQRPATWRWVLDVALLGTVHGIHSFVPHLVRQGHGHVLNTASVGGLMPLPTLAPYNAAKHGVVGLTETLHRELRARSEGLGATVLCPGRVETPLARTSSANRPDGVPDPSPGDPEPAAGAGGGLVLAADEVARLALEGVEAGRLHVITHPDSAAPVRARVERLLADLPATHERI